MPDRHYRLENGIKGHKVVGYSEAGTDLRGPSNVANNKNKAIRAAKQLGYDNGVIDQLKEANTPEEISRIMCTARKRSLG
jgi:hypothetical protein